MEIAMQKRALLNNSQFLNQRVRPYIDEDSAIADYYSVNREINSYYQHRLFAVLRRRQNLLMAEEIRSKSITNKLP
ncbi:MAG: hypothetical protein WBQ37_05560 [Candidatus Competibacter sp.]